MILGQYIETFFHNIPLSLLQFWGSFAFFVGLLVMLFAYSGFIFHTGTKWSLGREWHSWDAKAFISMGITFVSIWVTGYIGSFFVLVPGAQTFESLKDLAVFTCIVLFGYPALLVVPFAYGLSDFYEGIPLDFMSDWWIGYFINPACFWIAHQLIGKCPDFKRKKTWAHYGIFVLFFMTIEPALWGFICSGKFSTRDAYTIISPALFFTTSVTWCAAPFVMMVAFPLFKKWGLYWADIPGYAKQKFVRGGSWIWEAGASKEQDIECKTDSDAGVPIRFFILAPFIVTSLFIMGATSYFSLKRSEKASLQQAQLFHKATAEKINIEIQGLKDLDKISVDKNVSAFIINQSGELVSTINGHFNKEVIKTSILTFKENLARRNLQFKIHIKSPRQLSQETWLIQALPVSGAEDLILLTAVPEHFYLSGVRKAQSESALVFALGLIIVLLVVGVLGSYVIHPIRRLCHASHKLSEGDLSQRVPESRLAEMNTLSIAFNSMASKLQSSFQEISDKESRIKLAVESGNLGIWEWNILSDKVYWNDIMFRQYGLEPGEINSFSAWSKMVVPEDYDRVYAEIQAALKGEKKYHVEYRVRWKDGSIHVINASSNTLRNEKGEPVKMIGVSYDVTARRTEEKELKLYRNQLEEVIARRTEELTQKSDQLAKAEVYKKIAQIFLSMRDYTNSPLQAQIFSINLLKKRSPEHKDIIENLELSVQKLSSINRILSRLESSFTSERLMSEKEILSYLDKMEHRPRP